MFLTSSGGRLGNQLPCFATSSNDASTPCCASCCTATPMFHCIAVGGLPPAMRFSAAACSACGPTDASSTQIPPRLLYSFANTATARDSPPLVHQCMTSAFCASAGCAPYTTPTSAEAAISDFHMPITSPICSYESGYIMPLNASAPFPQATAT